MRIGDLISLLQRFDPDDDIRIEWRDEIRSIQRRSWMLHPERPGWWELSSQEKVG